MLYTKDLSFQYEKAKPLQFPNIECQRGEKWLILGQSGCGKTTLLHLLGGLLTPKSGSIFVNETELHRLSPSVADRFRGKNIGIVFQKSHFVQSLTVEENLLLAQQLGFAESNPKLDIGGFDAANKLAILLAHSFGVVTKTDAFIFNGIENISLNDAVVAKEKHYSIKLVANAQKLADGKLAAFLLPQFVAESDDLYHVKNEFNAVTTESTFSDKHFFKGKGAGAFPTASAVLSDISALRYDYKYEYKKIHHQTDTVLSNQFYLKVFVSVDDIAKLNKEDFEWIEEWHNEFNFSWLTGVIHADKLFSTDWWKQGGVSLILYPEAIIENIDYKKISKRSLELAGVV